MGNKMTCMKLPKKPHKSKDIEKIMNGKKSHNIPRKEKEKMMVDTLDEEDLNSKKSKYYSASFQSYDVFKKHYLAVSNSDLSKYRGNSTIVVSKPAFNKDHYYVVAEGKYE